MDPDNLSEVVEAIANSGSPAEAQAAVTAIVVEELAESVEELTTAVEEVIETKTGEDEKWNQTQAEISTLKSSLETTGQEMATVKTSMAEVQSLLSQLKEGVADLAKLTHPQTQPQGLELEPATAEALPPVTITENPPEAAPERKQGARYKLV